MGNHASKKLSRLIYEPYCKNQSLYYSKSVINADQKLDISKDLNRLLNTKEFYLFNPLSKFKIPMQFSRYVSATTTITLETT